MAANGTPVIEQTEFWAEEKVYSTSAFYAQETMYLTNGIYAQKKVAFVSEFWAQKKVVLAGCFPKFELIHKTPDLCVPIGLLKPGDKICSWDIEQKKPLYTAVTEIHKHLVMEIICFNNTMRVSSSHPLLVMATGMNGIHIPQWKVAFDVNVGDCLVDDNGNPITIWLKSNHWHNAGIEVLNLSTDSGLPFLVRGCVVRANNAKDCVEWANMPITLKFAA